MSDQQLESINQAIARDQQEFIDSLRKREQDEHRQVVINRRHFNRQRCCFISVTSIIIISILATISYKNNLLDLGDLDLDI